MKLQRAALIEGLVHFVGLLSERWKQISKGETVGVKPF